MMSDDFNFHQIQTLTEAVAELRTANKEQSVFNTEVIRFMSSVTTWGKAGLILWSVGQALLVVVLAKLI